MKLDPAFVKALRAHAGAHAVAEQLADPHRVDIFATCAACGQAARLEVEGRPMVPIEIRRGTLMHCDCGMDGVLEYDEGGGWIVIEPLPAEFCARAEDA